MSTSPTAATSNKIRVGLIGAGNWANHGHLRVLDLLPEYEVIAIQARRREASETAAAKFGIAQVVDTVEELVAISEVDLVLVLNTAPQHAETVRTVIAAGKDVYCEWPLTVSTEIAEELVELTRKAGVRHVVGLQRRIAPHTYFAGCALRTHLSGPFAYARRGVTVEEIAPWREADEIWRRMRIDHPDHAVTLGRRQIVYVGPDGLIRRHDASWDAIGGAMTATYLSDYRTFDGMRMATRARSYPAAPDGTSIPSPLRVTIELLNAKFYSTRNAT